MLAVIAGYRRKLVQNPTPLAPISPRIPVCYAATNSSRAAMLIRLIFSPADENRSGANQMRQHLSFWEHFTRGNAASYPDCRATGMAEAHRASHPAGAPMRRRRRLFAQRLLH